MTPDGKKKREANLIPTTKRSKSEVRKNAAKGGRKSGEVRRQKKLLKDCLDELLQRQWENRQGEKMSGSEAISVAVFKKALAGDIKAYEVVRDTAGQKPVDKIMLAEVDQTTINEVESMVLGEDDDNQKTGG
jgi:hypothetical protein